MLNWALFDGRRMECHKCEFNGKGDPRCISCAGDRDEIPQNNHGVSSVSIEELAGTEYEPRVPWRPSPEALAAADEREGLADAAGFPFPQMLDFLQRLFTLTPQEFAAVRAVAVRNRSAEHARPDFLREIAAEIGVPSKQAVKAVVARAVSRCPELRALVPLSLSFTSADAARLRAALADGATFPGRLALTAGGFLSSPVAPGTADPGAAFWNEAARRGACSPRKPPKTPGKAPPESRPGPQMPIAAPETALGARGIPKRGKSC